MKTKTVTSMTDEQFNIVLTQIKRVGKLTSDLIQRAAMFAIYQSIAFRNSTPACNLYLAMPEGTRRNALAAYFELHGNLAYLKGDKRKPIQFFDVEDMTGNAITFNETLLSDNPWHKAAPEVDHTSAWDVKEKLDKLLTSLERAVKNHEREVTHKELIAKVREVLAEGAV